MTAAIEEKKCTICGLIKAVPAFHRNKGMTGGYMNQCRVCRQKIDKESHGNKTWEEINESRSTREVFAWNKNSWEEADAWHLERQKQQDLMNRDVPYYPSNETGVYSGKY